MGIHPLWNVSKFDPPRHIAIKDNLRYLGPMDDFHKISSHMLEELADFFETSWSQADVDLVDETLTVTLPTGRQYVINKHGVTCQIWVASPFTGAHHFRFTEGAWKCTRTNIRLEDLLVKEHNDHVA